MNTNKSKQLLGTLAAGLAVFMSTERAKAQTTYTIGNGGLESGFNLSLDSSTDVNALVGGINLSTGSSSFNTVCTDVLGTVSLGSSYSYVSQSFSAFQAGGLDPKWGADNAGKTSANYDTVSATDAIQNAAWLMGRYGIPNPNNPGADYMDVGTVTQKAALQLAVWDVLYNTTATGVVANNLSGGGRFSATGTDAAAITLANTLIASVNWVTETKLAGNILQPVDGNGNPIPNVQEMLLVTTPVPEPTTVLAGALLLLPFGVSTLRFFRKNSAA